MTQLPRLRYVTLLVPNFRSGSLINIVFVSFRGYACFSLFIFWFRVGNCLFVKTQIHIFIKDPKLKFGRINPRPITSSVPNPSLRIVWHPKPFKSLPTNPHQPNSNKPPDALRQNNQPAALTTPQIHQAYQTQITNLSSHKKPPEMPKSYLTNTRTNSYKPRIKTNQKKMHSFIKTKVQRFN